MAVCTRLRLMPVRDNESQRFPCSDFERGAQDVSLRFGLPLPSIHCVCPPSFGRFFLLLGSGEHRTGGLLKGSLLHPSAVER